MCRKDKTCKVFMKKDFSGQCVGRFSFCHIPFFGISLLNSKVNPLFEAKGKLFAGKGEGK